MKEKRINVEFEKYIKMFDPNLLGGHADQKNLFEIVSVKTKSWVDVLKLFKNSVG